MNEASRWSRPQLQPLPFPRVSDLGFGLGIDDHSPFHAASLRAVSAGSNRVHQTLCEAHQHHNQHWPHGSKCGARVRASSFAPRIPKAGLAARRDARPTGPRQPASPSPQPVLPGSAPDPKASKASRAQINYKMVKSINQNHIEGKSQSSRPDSIGRVLRFRLSSQLASGFRSPFRARAVNVPSGCLRMHEASVYQHLLALDASSLPSDRHSWNSDPVFGRFQRHCAASSDVLVCCAGPRL